MIWSDRVRAPSLILLTLGLTSCANVRTPHAGEAVALQPATLR